MRKNLFVRHRLRSVFAVLGACTVAGAGYELATAGTLRPGEGRFYYGSGDRYEIGAYDSVGALRMLIRRPMPDPPVTAESIESYKSEPMARAPDDAAARRLWEEIIEDAPYPESFPAYRRMQIDRVGLLWVQEYDPPRANTVTWSVFDREGQWVSEVTIPQAWQVMEIGADYLLVLVHDDLDIERVQRHALVRG
jgi:hypothetical protein